MKQLLLLLSVCAAGAYSFSAGAAVTAESCSFSHIKQVADGYDDAKRTVKEGYEAAKDGAVKTYDAAKEGLSAFGAAFKKEFSKD